MDDEHYHLDDALMRLEQGLRSGSHMLASLQLAELALKLDRAIRREERLLGVTGRPAVRIRQEHASLRRLVGSVAAALDRADDRRARDLITQLRSVLLLHAAKEEPFLAAAREA